MRSRGSAQGETVIDPTIVSRVIARRPAGRALADLSSARVRGLERCVAEGLSNHAIAERLGINDRTVETHIAQVFLKLQIDPSPDAHRRVQAVLAFLRSNEPR